jgi:hypothetical protein
VKGFIVDDKVHGLGLMNAFHGAADILNIRLRRLLIVILLLLHDVFLPHFIILVIKDFYLLHHSIYYPEAGSFRAFLHFDELLRRDLEFLIRLML